MLIAEAANSIDITWQPIVIVISIVTAVGGFLYWHFKEVNKFKDEVHKIEMKLKELESKDALQQQALDQLNKLYPIINKVMDNFPNEKK